MEALELEKDAAVSQEKLEEVFSLQQKYSLVLRSESYRMRKSRLLALRHWVLSHRDEIREAVFLDFGKPAFEADLSESFVVLSSLNQAIRNLKKWTSSVRVPSGFTFLGTSSSIVYEPKGVCLIISPWNYPFNLAVGPLVSALAAGNTAIVKPSELTPNTSRLIRKMIEELFPPELAFVAEGDADVSRSLLKLPFNHIFFTGSTTVGKLVMEAASRHLASVTLELGGKSPVIVDQTSDLADAAEKIAWGKLLNAGQTCVSPDYLFVHASVRDRFLQLLRDKMIRLFDPQQTGLAGSGIYTRIVNQKHFSRLRSLLDDALAHGAKLYHGGDSLEDERFIGPAILTDVSPDARIMQEEIFGPLLPVNSFSDHSEVISFINARSKPLSLYVFSKDTKVQRKYMRETSAGSACVNDVVLQFQHPFLPFGGVNESGLGKSHGFFGFKSFSNEKAWLRQRTGLTSAKLLYPPYTPAKQRFLDFLMKYF